MLAAHHMWATGRERQAPLGRAAFAAAAPGHPAPHPPQLSLAQSAEGPRLWDCWLPCLQAPARPAPAGLRPAPAGQAAGRAGATPRRRHQGAPRPLRRLRPTSAEGWPCAAKQRPRRRDGEPYEANQAHTLPAFTTTDSDAVTWGCKQVGVSFTRAQQVRVLTHAHAPASCLEARSRCVSHIKANQHLLQNSAKMLWQVWLKYQ